MAISLGRAPLVAWLLELRARLPSGNPLPEEIWIRRHHLLVALVGLHVVGLAFLAFMLGRFEPHMIVELSAIAGMGALGLVTRFPRVIRANIVTLGLFTCSAILVHLSGGKIEMHFHFFVIVGLIVLYHEWSPFLVGIGFVVAQHAILGALSPEAVYNHNAAIEAPFLWALIHGVFVLAASGASIFAWREEEVAEARAIAADTASRKHEDRYRKLFENAGDIVYTLDTDGHFTSINPAAQAITGFSPEHWIGRNISDFLPAEQRSEVGDGVFRGLADEDAAPHEMETVAADGTLVHLESTARVIYENSEAVGFEGIARDVSDRKAHERELIYLAEHDTLTGLPNRWAFEERLSRTILMVGSDGPAALLYLDLDQFKVVNDTFGHASGDQLLVAVAGVLRDVVGSEGFVARLGGDEFAVLLERSGVNEAMVLAENLCSALGDFRYSAAQEVCYARVSVGVAVADSALSASELLTQADFACYAAKAHGRNRAELYTRGVEELERLSSDANWVVRITDAMHAGRLSWLFQPIVRVDNGEIDHYEALLRLCDDDGQVVPAADFIPAAERSGLIEKIDRMTVGNALALLQRTPERLAVNISARTLVDRKIVEAIHQEIRTSGVDPALLSFELTETSLIANLGRATTNIELLRALGCTFALDDFGTGFSSFSYLRQLPVDVVKIDGSFVRDLSDPVNAAVVRSINEVAHSMSKTTIAECVEDASGMGALKEMCVDLAQGYYIGRPENLPSDLTVARAS